MDKNDLEARFTYHPPKEGQKEKYDSLRFSTREFADEIERLCPDSREKSLAFTKLEECVSWAVKAIARHE